VDDEHGTELGGWPGEAEVEVSLAGETVGILR
jgi:hypothetical protein